MASFIATNTSTTTGNGFVFPGTDDELFVPLNVYIQATGAGFVGVTGPGGGTVRNNGQILGYDAGISLGAADQTTTILNFAAGTISSGNGAAIVAVATGAGGSVDIENAGIVSATTSTSSAISIDGAGRIVNNGLITSAGVGIYQLGSVASTSIFSLINDATGTIVGGYDAKDSLVVEQISNYGLINGGLVLGDGDGASFTNQASGSVTGPTTGSGGFVTFGDGDNGTFQNFGTMGTLTWGDGNQAYGLNQKQATMGGITFGNGNGAFFGNAGTVNGTVLLGNGTGQIFDSSGGTIYDAVTGEAGTIVAGANGAIMVGALNGGHLIGGAGSDVLIASQSNLVGYNVVTTLDGKGGSNALYGGQGTNLFLSGDATFNQIWGRDAASSPVDDHSNNTVDYGAVTGAGRGIYVDLLYGHNAYIIDNGSYTLIDSIANVPNVNGTNGVDIIRGSNDIGIIEGRGGGDHLYSASFPDPGAYTTFVYSAYGDSNLVTGYDTISGFKTGLDKIDVSALGLSAANVLIESDATSTVLYFEMTPGTFNAATDLAISFAGANALAVSDITFASSTPNGWSFYDYNSFYGTGYPVPNLMPTGTTAFDGIINVGLVLERAHDPTSLLQADWGTRQKLLAAAGDNPLDHYGASEGSYSNLLTALGSLGIELSANSSYESSAQSRTAWVSLTAMEFNSLFGQTLMLQDGTTSNIFWNGNLVLNPVVASLGTVKGLSFDIDNSGNYMAPIGSSAGLLPDGSSAGSGSVLSPGPQQPGNDTGDTGNIAAVPVQNTPQAIAQLYNFPFANLANAPPTGAIALIEPGMGNYVSGDGDMETLLGNYRSAIGLAPDVTIYGQQPATIYETDTSERALDIGVATAVNPNSALRLYAGSGVSDNSGASTYTAYQSAFLDPLHASVVSSSFRFTSSQAGADSPFLWAARELMIDAALQNITVFQSSGDGGSSYGTPNGLTNTANARASEYSVIVGGTSLSTGASAAADPTLNGLNSVVSLAQSGNPATLWQLVAGGLSQMPTTGNTEPWFLEAVWNEYRLTTGDTFLFPGYLENEAGNGGVDYTQPTPWYQSALLPFDQPVTTDAAHVTGRGVPDVAALAGGNMKYLVPQPDFSGTGPSALNPSGGTSASAPFWASLAIQINTVFEDQNLPDLGYMTDLLYIAAAIAPASFNDVSIGNDNSSFVWGGSTYTTAYKPPSGDPPILHPITPTDIGYSAEPGYDLVTGLGSPNGVLLARALTAIAQAQYNYSDSPDIADWTGSAWQSGTAQTLLVQTTLPHGAGIVSVTADGDTLSFLSQATDSYAWTSRFAGQVEQSGFDSDLMLLFDHQSQGTLGQLSVEASDALSVTINGSQASGSAGLLTGDFGFIDFQTADGSSVRLARPVAVAEIVPALLDDPQPTGTTVVRLRQSDGDSLAVRFYKVDDYNGTVGLVAPGEAGYAAAVTNAAYAVVSPSGVVAEQNWLIGPGNGGFLEATMNVQQGDIIAMQLQNLTTGNTYWAFSQANESVGGQHVGHLWNYGLNTWGWEAGQGGGDHDFNDLVVQLDFTSAYGHGYLMS